MAFALGLGDLDRHGRSTARKKTFECFEPPCCGEVCERAASTAEKPCGETQKLLQLPSRQLCSMEGEEELRALTEGSSRFAHLLKPIRDLADNWGIDIANDLEEYLTHLNRTTFAFDGGPQLDFAEAALLIQSSACVYSRKVDFLHTLVYQALEAVRSKKRATEADAVGDGEDGAGRAAGTQRERRSKVDAGDWEDDTLEGFMTAGLNLKQADDIDLGIDEDTGAPMYIRTPAALLALEDQGGSGAGGDGDAGFYRLAHCYVHISGALLLDANDAEYYDQLLNNTGVAPATSYWDAATAKATQAVPAAQALLVTNQQQKQGQQGDGDEDEGGDGAGGGMTDDDDEHAAQKAATEQAAPTQQPAATLGDAPALTQGVGTALMLGPPAAESSMVVQPAAVGGEGKGEDGHEAGHGIARQRRMSQRVAKGNVAADQSDWDPWAPLDMDAPSQLPVKPMQVKRPSRSIKSKPVAVQPLNSNWMDLTPNTQASLTKLPAAVRAKAANLVNPEFAYGFELLYEYMGGAPAAAAGKASRQRRGLAAAEAGPMFEAADAQAAADEIQAAIQAEEMAQQAAAPDAADMQMGMGMLQDAADGQDGNGGGGGMTDDDDGGYADAYGSGLDINDLLHVAGGLGLGQDTAHDAHMVDSNAGDNSYEAQCRAHIESMMQAAAAQEVQSELARRVSGWRSKIDPVLHNEEARSAFDIQQYQQRIVKQLDKQQQQCPAASIGFEAVGSLADKWEVSRTFTAMLQLINNRNIALIRPEDAPDAPFQLQLLNAELLHKSMAARLAGDPAGQDTGQQGTQAAADQEMDAAAADSGMAEDDDRIMHDDDEHENVVPDGVVVHKGKQRGGRRATKKARASQDVS